MNSTRERAIGALEGLALGDALGMPTQSMSAQWIYAEYGKITGLNDAIAQQPIAPNMPAGSVTDDTEQAMLVARLIVENSGHVDPMQLAHELLDWEDDMRRRGSLDLLGPSTKLALEQVRSSADVKSTGRTGTTNGAAMRVTPVGIANSAAADPDRFAERVHESCRVTHNTVHGFKSAALVAAAVSYGIDGFSIRESLQKALALIETLDSKIADFDCAWSPKADVATRAYAAIEIAKKDFDSEDDFLEVSAAIAEHRWNRTNLFQQHVLLRGDITKSLSKRCAVRLLSAEIQTLLQRYAEQCLGQQVQSFLRMLSRKCRKSRT